MSEKYNHKPEKLTDAEWAAWQARIAKNTATAKTPAAKEKTQPIDSKLLKQHEAAKKQKAAIKSSPEENKTKTPVAKNISKAAALLIAAVCLVVGVTAVFAQSSHNSGAAVTEDASSSVSQQRIDTIPIDPPGTIDPPAVTEPVPAAEPEPEPEPLPEPDPPVLPAALEVPPGGWKPMQFSAEETAAMDALLDAWATASITQEEESSSMIEEAPNEDASSFENPGWDSPNTGARYSNVAVYFKDLDSGAEYIYNGAEKFDIASLSKAPYALYLYQLADQGLCDLQETITVTADSVAGSENNSGVLKNDPDLPRDLTVEELIGYLLRNSDTVAQRVLLTRYPAQEYAAWAAELGLANPENLRGVTNDLITAPDAGVYLQALYTYMQTGENGARLQEHLMSTGYPILQPEHPLARKYGWDSYAYHDMAVVYAPHPYFLAILTDKSQGEDRAMFTQIASAFEEIMAEKWIRDQTLDYLKSTVQPEPEETEAPEEIPQ